MLETVRVSVAQMWQMCRSAKLASDHMQGYRCCSNTLTCVDSGQHCLFADLFHHSAQSVNTERAIFVPDGLHGAVCFGPVASRES